MHAAKSTDGKREKEPALEHVILGRPTRCRNVVSTFSRAPKNIVFTKTSFFRRVEFDFFL